MELGINLPMAGIETSITDHFEMLFWYVPDQDVYKRQVIRWIRLVNDTAVAVDQLGMRQGAAAVYLDAWHRDLPEFLQLRTNNGDDRMKAHDVFPAVCYPDLFWRLAEENIDAPWHLMCCLLYTSRCV